MEKIVGIRFKPAGKIYDFDPGAFVLNIGDQVIVETEHGLAMGTVVVPPLPFEEKASAIPEGEPPRIYKKVFRLATEKDYEQLQKNHEFEKQAHDFCIKCIQDIELDMNLFSVESNFDTTKLTFFFTAEGRIDFRQLVKLLVQEFCIRIEMRQVGIRNQAKMCGGIGRCGREICCASFLEKFEPVSIRMAKEQGLSLNPTKISGLCGRLMCCLTFENDTYQALREELLDNKNCPQIGKTVKFMGRKGRVIRHNVIGKRITIRLDDGSEVETEISKVEVIENRQYSSASEKTHPDNHSAFVSGVQK